MVCGFFGLVAMAGLGCTESGNGIAGFSTPTRLAPATANVAKSLLVVTNESQIMDPNAVSIDGFGDAIALDGNTAIVGAPMANKAYVFVRSNGLWSQPAILEASGGGAGDRFGASVAIDGDTAIVGAPNHGFLGDPIQAGAAYLFVRNASTGVWGTPQKIWPLAQKTSDHFGNAVALHGDTALVGAIDDDVGTNTDQGSAYVFTNSGGVWTEQKTLVATNGAAMDAFGGSVSLSGNTALIGAPLHKSGGLDKQGAAYVFVGGGMVWDEQKELVASNGAAFDEFGGSVSLSGDTALVGAALHDSTPGALDQGAAYFFVRSGTLWTQQLPPVIASNGKPGDRFGASVSVSGDIAIVEASNSSVAINGETGSAYFFVRNGNAWAEDTQLIPNNGLDFRAPVAISGNTALVAKGNSNQEVVNAFVFLKGNGDPCGSATECASMFCVDGVCCNSACNDGYACTTDSCQTGACVITPVACPAALCHDAYCDPTDGLCKTEPQTDGTKCDDNLACTRIDTCQNGDCVGNPIECPNVDNCHVGICNELTGTCGTIVDASNSMCVDIDLDDGMKCIGKAQCKSGYCVDGVCCNEACDVGCHSCVLPNFVGTCALEPRGEDRRGDCGEPLACSQTCSGSEIGEMCVDVDKDTKCGGGGCFDKTHSQLPVFCTIKANDNSCDAPTIQDCGDYLCNDTDGVCRTHCETADDCAPGLACDPQGRCGKPPREVTSCSFTNRGHASGSSVVFFGGVLVVFSWLRRRTRTSRHPFALFMLALLGIAGCGVEPIPQVNLEMSPQSIPTAMTVNSLNWPQQQQLATNDGAESDEFGYSVALDGDTAIVGVPFANVGMNAGQGAAFAFVRDGLGVWTKQAKLTTNSGMPNDTFGTSVSLSGNTAMVGAVGANAFQGAVYVFERDANGAWTETPIPLVADDGAANDLFGTSVSLSGDTAIVGARFATVGANALQGSAYVFVRNAMGVWTQQAKLKASNGMANDYFGVSVSLSGNTAIVGALYGDGMATDSGSAYVFVRDAMGIWTEQAKVVAGDGAADDYFGTSVSLSGNTAIVGAPSSDGIALDVGAAYAFVRDGFGNWTQQDKLINVGAGPSSFGKSVSLVGETALVGVPYGDGGIGFARVFKRSGVVWTEHTTLKANVGLSVGSFGDSVALSGDTALVGAPTYYVDIGTPDLGLAYVFVPGKTGGDTCNWSGECLAGVCIGGICGKTTGDMCATPSECANGICIGGICGKINGGACATGMECASGFCVDTVCCNSICNGGPCDVCSTGACILISDVSCDDNNPCTQTDTCQSGVCAGSNPKACSSDDCHDAYCDPNDNGICKELPKPDNSICNDHDACTLVDTCQSGTCSGTNPKLCPKLDACHIGHCVSDTGQCVSAIDTTNSDCPKLELGVKCVVDSDCNSGNCVDGVCCNSRCEGNCYSCVLPGKVGQCQVENENQDRRGLCSPNGPCVRTCSGKMPDPLDPNADPCIDATTATQCTLAQCVDPTHSLDAAFCVETETPIGDLVCGSATPTLKDCGNLACEEPSGACRAECINASDCSPGYACNPDHQCFPPPSRSSGETPSCSFAPHSSTTSFPAGFAATVAFLGIAFTRRRNRFTRVDP
jgi:hypothetical protein